MARGQWNNRGRRPTSGITRTGNVRLAGCLFVGSGGGKRTHHHPTPTIHRAYSRDDLSLLGDPVTRRDTTEGAAVRGATKLGGAERPYGLLGGSPGPSPRPNSRCSRPGH